jgi:hypothetical protein
MSHLMSCPTEASYHSIYITRKSYVLRSHVDKPMPFNILSRPCETAYSYGQGWAQLETLFIYKPLSKSLKSSNGV